MKYSRGIYITTSSRTGLHTKIYYRNSWQWGGEAMLTGHRNLRLKYLNCLVSRPALKVTSPPSHVKVYSPCSELTRGFLTFLLKTAEKNWDYVSEISKALFIRKITFNQPLVPLCPQTACKIIFLDDPFHFFFKDCNSGVSQQYREGKGKTGQSERNVKSLNRKPALSVKVVFAASKYQHLHIS